TEPQVRRRRSYRATHRNDAAVFPGVEMLRNAGSGYCFIEDGYFINVADKEITGDIECSTAADMHIVNGSAVTACGANSATSGSYQLAIEVVLQCCSVGDGGDVMPFSIREGVGRV